MNEIRKFLPLIMLIIGITIGFYGKPFLEGSQSDEKLKFVGNTRNKSALLDSPIEVSEATTQIGDLQTIIREHPEELQNLLETKKWVVEATTLQRIIAQRNMLNNPCEYVVFYPALTKKDPDPTKKRGITFVMIGTAKGADGKYYLIKKQGLRNPGGTTGVREAPGEVWDYIGPCPPFQNCPEDDF